MPVMADTDDEYEPPATEAELEEMLGGKEALARFREMQARLPSATRAEIIDGVKWYIKEDP
jgi:DNA-directed RNA polymerase specialized sigma24 family protein